MTLKGNSSFGSYHHCGECGKKFFMPAIVNRERYTYKYGRKVFCSYHCYDSFLIKVEKIKQERIKREEEKYYGKY